MQIKLVKFINSLRGRMIPIGIMALMIFMNLALTVCALEQIPEKPNKMRSADQVVLSTPIIHNGTFEMVDHVASPYSIRTYMVNSIEEYISTSAKTKEQIEQERIAEEQRVIAEQKRIEEEKRLLEEKRLAEEAEIKRIEQVKSITLSNQLNVPSNLTEEQIAYMLEDTDLAGTASTYYKIQQTRGFNIFTFVGISINEAGWRHTNSTKARVHNNVYGITVGKQTFTSMDECIEHTADFLTRLYLNVGLEKLHKIQPKYCPTNSKWDEEVWSHANKLYNKVMSKYGL